ncbi:MAG: substrate-binding domain-containing protein [Peptococcaceae bacterium]|nr:substrate-binding domain-containing protein [Peptococcaceae bacterium]
MNPHKVTVYALALLIALSGFGTGCGAINKLMGRSQPKQSQSSEQKKGKIAVLLAPEAENQAQIKKGLQDAAKKEGVKLVFLTGETAQKLTQQGKDVKAIIMQGGNQVQSSNPMTQNEQKSKAPIVAIDQVPGVDVAAMVMPDYYHIGELQADYLKATLKQGNVVLLQSAQPGAEDVVAGVKTGLAHNASLKITQTFASPTKNTSPTAALGEYLKANRTKVQAIVATDSKLALEAIEVLKENALSKQVMLVGAGTDIKAVEKIASGELNADVDKSPYLQGLYAYKLASQLSKQQATDADKTVITSTGETPTKLVPVQLVRRENLAQFQKIYTQPVVEPEAEAGKEKSGQAMPNAGGQAAAGGSEDGSAQGSSSEGGGAQGGQSGKNQGGGQQSQATASGQAAKAAGVAKVREKIRTETTREMLGQDGKVIGTEREVKEEVRTLPQALLEATQKEAQAQAQKSQGQTQDQQSQDKKSSQGQSSKEDQ